MDKEQKGLLLKRMSSAMAEAIHIELYNQIKVLFENGKINKAGSLTVKQKFIDELLEKNVDFSSLPENEKEKYYSIVQKLLQVQKLVLDNYEEEKVVE